jgi:hypothetical protein
MAEPSNEYEWTIHSINIHGVFFERWCARTISQTEKWNVKATNYPVAYPPSRISQDGKESNLDILAQSQNPTSVLTLGQQSHFRCSLSSGFGHSSIGSF